MAQSKTPHVNIGINYEQNLGLWSLKNDSNNSRIKINSCQEVKSDGRSVSENNGIFLASKSNATENLSHNRHENGEFASSDVSKIDFTSNGYSHGNGMLPLEADAVGDLQLHKYKCFPSCCLNGNVRTLWIMLIANSTFTVAQLIGAMKADSLAMYGDCSTMALDSLTYMLNIYAEKRKTVGTNETAKLEVFVAAFSIVTLVAVTAVLLWDAIRRLDSHHGKSDIVSADIMLEFSLGNLVIDIFSCSLFFARALNANKKQEAMRRLSISRRVDRSDTEDSSSSMENQGIELLKLPDSDSRLSIEINEDQGMHMADESETSLNMASAFVHLAADTLRTITVMVTAIIVDVDERDIDSMNADAVSSIVVSVIILLVAAFLSKETVDQYRKIENGAYQNVPSPQ